MPRKKYHDEKQAQKRVDDLALLDNYLSGAAKLETKRERDNNRRTLRRAQANQDIAILDLETDPFDAEKDEKIFPFCGVLYWRETEKGGSPVERIETVWHNEPRTFCAKIIECIEGLPRQFTIYAHNGGRFDYLFLLHLIRGRCLFKGRSLMAASIGAHELRDSVNIIPTKLAAFQKDDFDYTWLKREFRGSRKDAIISYCQSDARYTYDVVQAFISKHGRVLTIGSAAMRAVKKLYKFETLSPMLDKSIRPFFFGGRVECFKGVVHWHGPLKSYDVNSMYPAAMAYFKHPISAPIFRSDGTIRPETGFIELDCVSRGAFLQRTKTGELHAPYSTGRFCVSRHEFDTACALNLVDIKHIHRTIDFEHWITFAAFVLPLYAERERLLRRIDTIPKHTPEWYAVNRQILLIKLELNNAYGKFAQDPSKFKEVCLTDIGEYPADFTPPSFAQINDMIAEGHGINGKAFSRGFWGQVDFDQRGHYGPQEQTEHMWIWERPALDARKTFYNVAIAASITGAARSKLLHGIHTAKNVLYCDTDSLICEDLPASEHVEIDRAKLGAWKLEHEINECIIAGKKDYWYRYLGKDEAGLPAWLEKSRNKGTVGLSYDQFRAMVAGEAIEVFASRAPRIGRDGSQRYIKRLKVATAPRMEANFGT